MSVNTVRMRPGGTYNTLVLNRENLYLNRGLHPAASKRLFKLGRDSWRESAFKKDLIDHSQSPCRLETAACRLREGRRPVEDQPHAKEKNRREKTQNERQKIKIKVLHPCSLHFTSPSQITRQYKQDKTNTAKQSVMAVVFVQKCFSFNFKAHGK